MASPTMSPGAARHGASPSFIAPISQPDHLEAGVGTGYFLDKTADARVSRLVLLDINRHCLERAARRLARFKPELYQVDLLAPIDLGIAPFMSVGLTYVLALLARPHAREARRDRSSAAADGQGRGTVRRHHSRPRDRAEPRGTGRCSTSITPKAYSTIARTTSPPCATACGSVSMRSRSSAKAVSPCSAPPDQRFVRALHRHETPSMNASTDASKAASRSSALKAGMSACVAG